MVRFPSLVVKTRPGRSAPRDPGDSFICRPLSLLFRAVSWFLRIVTVVVQQLTVVTVNWPGSPLAGLF